MNSLNSILLEGELVDFPTFGTSTKGVSYCNFIIAINRFYKVYDEYVKEVSNFKIVTFSKLADTCNKHLTKGGGVRVVGRLKQNRWEDREGREHSEIVIVAEHIEFRW